MKPYLPFIFFIITLQASAQNWQFFIDSIPTLSSPRACDLNNDGIQDIVFGGGTDGAFSQNGIMAVNGANGTCFGSGLQEMKFLEALYSKTLPMTELRTYSLRAVRRNF